MPHPVRGGLKAAGFQNKQGKPDVPEARIERQKTPAGQRSFKEEGILYEQEKKKNIICSPVRVHAFHYVRRSDNLCRNREQFTLYKYPPPVSTSSNSNKPGESGANNSTADSAIVVTEFHALSETVAYQSVKAKTPLSELTLPSKLEADGYRKQKKATDSEPDPKTITVTGVKWELTEDLNDGITEYDPNAEEGLYVFTPVLPDRYELSGASLPEIYVSVGMGISLYTATDSNAWSGKGAGTATDPYLIENSEQLAELATNVNGGQTYENKYFQISKDAADLYATVPIGTWGGSSEQQHPFSGSFDGNGQKVSLAMLAYDDTQFTKDYRGFFGYLAKEGSVKNLGVDGGEDTGVAGLNYVGGIAGYNAGTIKDCYSATSVYADNTYAGGIAGKNTGSIKNSYNVNMVTAKTYAGGVAGTNDGTVEHCYNTGEIAGMVIVSGKPTAEGTECIGGITGRLEPGGFIQYCYNTGAVSGGTSYIGGVAGSISGKTRHCISLGATVTGAKAENGGGFSTLHRITGKIDTSGGNSGEATLNQARNEQRTGLRNEERFVKSPNSALDGVNVTVGKDTSITDAFKGWDTDIWEIPTGSLEVDSVLPTLRKAPQIMKDTSEDDSTAEEDGIVKPTLPAIPITLYYDSSSGKLYMDKAKEEPYPEGPDWSGDAATLTLENFEYKTYAPTSLVMPANSTLFLKGGNSIINTHTRAEAFNMNGLQSEGNLTIKSDGSGSLTLVSGMNPSFEADTGSTGLHCKGVLTVDNAAVQAYGGLSMVSSEGIYAAASDDSSAAVILQNNAHVMASSHSEAFDVNAQACGTGLYINKGTVKFDKKNRLLARGTLDAIRLTKSIDSKTIRSMSYAPSFIGPVLEDTDIEKIKSGKGSSFDTNLDTYVNGSDRILYLKVIADTNDGLESTEANDGHAPYAINTLTDLRDLSEDLSHGYLYEGKYFKQSKDIDMNSKEDWFFKDVETEEDAKEKPDDPQDTEQDFLWIPIGSDVNRFMGTYDGDGKVVQNLALTKKENKDTNYQGLFGYIGKGGTVQCLGVTGEVNGQDTVGGITAYNAGTVVSCYNNAMIKAESYAGGIAGENYGEIMHCYNTGEITVNIDHSGGIAGANIGRDGKGIISNCYNTGNITGSKAGGITGRNYTRANVNNCVALNLLITGSSQTGRITGDMDTISTLTDNKARSDMKIGENGKEALVVYDESEEPANAANVPSKMNGAHLIVSKDTKLAEHVFTGWNPPSALTSIWNIPVDGKLTLGSALPVLSSPKQNPAPVLPGIAGKVENLTWKLTSNDGSVTLEGPGLNAETGCAFYYKADTKSADKPATDTINLTGWTSFTEDTTINWSNDIPVYIQVAKVETVSKKLLSWGQVDTHPLSKNLDVVLTAKDGLATLGRQKAAAGYTYYYKADTKAALKPSTDTADLTGWTSFTADTNINWDNGTRVYVQILRVETASNKIQAWGQADALPLGTDLTVALSSGNGRATLDAQNAYPGYTYYYKADEKSADRPAPGTVDLTGWTSFTSDVYIPWENGSRIYVQVLRVETDSHKIQAWGQADAVPANRSGGSGGGGGGSSTGLRPSYRDSLPKNYVGGTKIVSNVRVPDYTVEGSWQQTADGQWHFTGADGTKYAGNWAAAFNPYANLDAGQSAFDWFLFDERGAMVTGWYTDASGNTYYLNEASDNTKGAMAIGWNQINGQYYYFNEEPDGTRGRLLKNTTTPDGFYVDENGVRTTQA